MAFILVAQNISNLADISDYKVEVLINAIPIWRGMVKGHRREDGWEELVRKIADVAQQKA